MNLPALPVLVPLLAVEVLGEASPVTVGLAIGLAAVGAAWGQASMQIAALREWKRQAMAESEALEKRLTAVEVREGRTVERIDNLCAQLARIEKKLDTLLERRASAS